MLLRPAEAVPAPGADRGTGTARTSPHAGTGRRRGLPAAGAAGDKRVRQVMAQQLEAALLFIEGRREEALVLARQAAVVEDSLSFEFGPPVPVKPANEQVGEMLMDLRRPKEAMQAFELSLKRTPSARCRCSASPARRRAPRTPRPRERAYGELRRSGRRRTRRCRSSKRSARYARSRKLRIVHARFRAGRYRSPRMARLAGSNLARRIVRSGELARHSLGSNNADSGLSSICL